MFDRFPLRLAQLRDLQVALAGLLAVIRGLVSAFFGLIPDRVNEFLHILPALVQQRQIRRVAHISRGNRCVQHQCSTIPSALRRLVLGRMCTPVQLLVDGGDVIGCEALTEIRHHGCVEQRFRLKLM